MRELIKKVLLEARFSNYEVSDEPYAKIFYVFLTEFNSSQGFQKSNLRRAFQYAIREYTNKPHKLISQKVADHFIRNFPDVNPYSIRWNQRKKYGVVNGKSFLLFEHTTPVKTFLISLSKCKTLEEVKQVMKDYSGVCVISRPEDDCLRTGGYNMNRPDGWKRAYESCDIRVLDETTYNNYRIEKLNQIE